MKYRLDAPIDELLDMAKAKFRIRFEPIRVGGRELDLLHVMNMSEHLESLAARTGGEGVSLPLWAKVWPTALPTALLVQKLPVDPGAALLEIGTGTGVVGLFAAAAGHRVVLTDINPEALLFCQINILKNGLGDLARAAEADFAKARMGERFRWIVGCEVLYLPRLHAPLLEFLKAHIEPGPLAEVILSVDHTRAAGGFFQEAAKDFRVAMKTFNLAQESGETKQGVIFRLKAKTDA